MEEVKYTKNCHKCGIIQKYDSLSHLNQAIRRNVTCLKCRRKHGIGRKHTEETKAKMSRSGKGKKRLNPRRLSEQEKINIRARMIGNTFGKNVKHTEEHKLYMSVSQKGRTFTEETKIKMRLACKGRKPTPETQEKINKALKRGDDHPNKKPHNREKLRLAYLRKKEAANGKLVAFYNKSACQIFNQINSYFGWKGVHAENEGERAVRGWWLDYYEPEQNIVIEYDEKYHEKRAKKDEIKQKEVTEILGCKFYRLKDGDCWKELLKGYTPPLEVNIKAHSSIK